MENINTVVQQHHSYFNRGISKNVDFRIDMLKRLRKAIIRHEENIYDALWNDLHKSKEEAYITEISIVLKEIDFHIKSVKRWAKPKRVGLPFRCPPFKYFKYLKNFCKGALLTHLRAMLKK